MRILLQQVELCFPQSTHHNKKCDVLLEYGKVKLVQSSIEVPPRTKVLTGGVLAPGFVDIGCFGGEPGYEQRETKNSLKKTAARGGYTQVYVLPNLNPVTDNRSAVEFLKEDQGVVAIHPLGAVSHHLKGIDLAEIYDMHHSGVQIFTDGLKSIQNIGLMKRSLEYVKSFDGIILNQPNESSIEPDGVIHESTVSTAMGLKGIPELAETSMLKRDLDLLEYTGSKLISHNLSTAQSVQLIKEAKQKKLQVFASVAIMNLVENVEAVAGFDTHYLVNPPLRSESDRKALVKALLSGIIDIVVSGHMPMEEDLKVVEFGHAEQGVVSLPFVFPLLSDRLGKFFNLEQIIHWLSINPRQMLNLDPVTIEEGSDVDFVWIDPDGKTEYSQKTLPSKSHNSPYLNQTFQGKISGVFRGDQYELF